MQVIGMCIRHPALLFLAPSAIQHRLAAMQTLLAINHQTSIALLIQKPSLLGFRPALLADKHAALLELLQLPPAGVNQLIMLHPSLLTNSRSEIEACWHFLREYLAVDAPQLTQMLTHPDRGYPQMLLYGRRALEVRVQ